MTFRDCVLAAEAFDDLCRGDDGADALPGAPDVAPGLGLGLRGGVGVLAAAEVHGGRVGDGEVVRVESGGFDAAAQVVAVARR
ncbi:hypothetical protein JWS14_18745 [Rhodococcus koreensis]|nr:hypothetical protein JWS14_18745 [Rhodococcus koreensis]